MWQVPTFNNDIVPLNMTIHYRVGNFLKINNHTCMIPHDFRVPSFQLGVLLKYFLYISVSKVCWNCHPDIVWWLKTQWSSSWSQWIKGSCSGQWKFSVTVLIFCCKVYQNSHRSSQFLYVTSLSDEGLISRH